MTGWNLGWLARAAEANIVGSAADVPRTQVTGVSIDSRSILAGSVYVAIRGERFDGHQFIEQAIQAGAAAVVVESQHAKLYTEVSVPVLVVKDSLMALGNMAAAVRLSHPFPIVAITGSNGKTTTKELAAEVLKTHGLVHATAGNFNNLIGVPLTLFSWPSQSTIAVIEMGMNAPGEIARLADIAQPQVGLITNVAAAHLQGLGSIEGVAAAKGELFSALCSTDIAIVNNDDPMITHHCINLYKGKETVTYGQSEDAMVRLTNYQPTAVGACIAIDMMGQHCHFHIPLMGLHNALNAAAAAAIGLVFGIIPSDIVESLRNTSIPSGRSSVLYDFILHHGKGNITLIDDSYNANPASVESAIKSIVELAQKGRGILVLGDMLELGKDAAMLHQQIGVYAAEQGITHLLALGDYSHDTILGVGAGVGVGTSELKHNATAYNSRDALTKALLNLVTDGDVVLFKGSRGMRMEEFIPSLGTAANSYFKNPANLTSQTAKVPQ